LIVARDVLENLNAGIRLTRGSKLVEKVKFFIEQTQYLNELPARPPLRVTKKAYWLRKMAFLCGQFGTSAI